MSPRTACVLDGGYNKEWSALSKTLFELAKARRQAFDLLTELAEAKEESARQRELKETAMS